MRKTVVKYVVLTLDAIHNDKISNKATSCVNFALIRVLEIFYFSTWWVQVITDKTWICWWIQMKPQTDTGLLWWKYLEGLSSGFCCVRKINSKKYVSNFLSKNVIFIQFTYVPVSRFFFTILIHNKAIDVCI